MDTEVSQVKVIIVAAVRVYREGLQQYLSTFSRLQVCATVSTAAELEAASRQHKPQLLLVDTRVDALRSAIAEVRKNLADTRIVALAVSLKPAALVNWLRDPHIDELVSEEDSLDDLGRAVEAALENRFACSIRLAQMLRQCYAAPAQDVRDHTTAGLPLTDRQARVLELIDAGMPNKEIARTLGIEPTTVRNHVHHILRRLGAKNRSEAAAALRHH